MKIEIIEEKDNPFLKRKDLMIMIDHAGQPTPKKDDLVKFLAEKYKVENEKVEIVYIFSETGVARSKAKARIWKEKPKVKKKEEKPSEEVKPEEKEEKGEKVESEEKSEEERPEKKEESKPEEKRKEVSEKSGEGEKSET